MHLRFHCCTAIMHIIIIQVANAWHTNMSIVSACVPPPWKGLCPWVVAFCKKKKNLIQVANFITTTHGSGVRGAEPPIDKCSCAMHLRFHCCTAIMHIIIIQVANAWHTNICLQGALPPLTPRPVSGDDKICNLYYNFILIFFTERHHSRAEPFSRRGHTHRDKTHSCTHT